MNILDKTIIIRHKKENLKKCSLRGLEQREDFLFLSYPLTNFPNLSQTVILSIDAPPLTIADKMYSLLLIDATWRLAQKMEKVLLLQSHPLRRSLPNTFRTAYPRRQDDCPDPSRGLSSIEALFVAFHILGKKNDFLLDHYYWKDDFVEKNKMSLISAFC